jgi:hypothetical protein
MPDADEFTPVNFQLHMTFARENQVGAGEADDGKNQASDTRQTSQERPGGTLKEAVETLASGYFSACRKLARAVSRIKNG